MPDVVKQGQGLDQVFVQTQRPSDRSRDGGHFIGVRQASAVIVPHVPGEHLHLAAQATERRTVQDAVAVPLVRGAIRVVRFGVFASSRVDTVHRVGRQQQRFALPEGLQAQLVTRGTGVGSRHRWSFPRFISI